MTLVAEKKEFARIEVDGKEVVAGDDGEDGAKNEEGKSLWSMVGGW